MNDLPNQKSMSPSVWTLMEISEKDISLLQITLEEWEKITTTNKQTKTKLDGYLNMLGRQREWNKEINKIIKESQRFV